MRYTLRQLEVFVAVAQHESVSKAARALALSQSAASTALSELERQFDCQLLDRIGKRLKLNALGFQLLPKAVALLDRAEEVEELLRGQQGIGNLDVGATLTIGNYLATLLISDFMQRHPGSRVRLQVRNTRSIIDAVRHHQLDLGLIEGQCEEDEVITQPWVEDDLVVFCSPRHPLANRGPVELDRLLREDWIMREEGSGTRLTLEQAARHRRGRFNILLELEHTEGIKRAVESGLGIGCVSRLALRDAFRRGSLTPLPTPELDLSRQFTFIWHRHKYLTAGMREFLRQCRQMTEGIQRSDEIDLPQVP
ncbi:MULTISPECIES: LysR family transcriptional regulator [Halomonas]|jgi:DNA-binding transcriptional LysR family regulator|uniref:LysR family transcriptional regulator n=3 Tax=Halomonas TaxID=2745 RepID=A0AAU7KI71_9GAMM|nr:MULTISPECIES: LysR family transcriptional regulator [Halomonas]MBR9771493.1 LysR family transcriptional regulator [Gammaproteobacteria bacterium]KJZ08765.1 LysR family transcriptional regulator [Halomonas sp. S2151]MAR73182.1 LysR family transcriptional regulator [Halomonas sp.]MBR9880006.1 LysR family transcriptional regulator [Gammaproteobacteria bacterium]MBS8267706.1 LysR family transcriptional regulator [Halomonas litopenaei]|tara:strand:- start:2716 stop:3642 length:927 start_codon:yes stop_codon:yes gene_type:complete